MILSQSAEYALRAAVVLATLPEGVYLETAEVRRLANLPAAYATKILRRMVVAGVLDAKRGIGGGYRLARPAADIAFIDVLRAVEAVQPGPERCVFGHPACDADHPCAMHDAYVELRQCFHRWATSTTLDAQEGARLPTPWPARRG